MKKLKLIVVSIFFSQILVASDTIQHLIVETIRFQNGYFITQDSTYQFTKFIKEGKVYFSKLHSTSKELNESNSAFFNFATGMPIRKEYVLIEGLDTIKDRLATNNKSFKEKLKIKTPDPNAIFNDRIFYNFLLSKFCVDIDYEKLYVICLTSEVEPHKVKGNVINYSGQYTLFVYSRKQNHVISWKTIDLNKELKSGSSIIDQGECSVIKKVRKKQILKSLENINRFADIQHPCTSSHIVIINGHSYFITEDCASLHEKDRKNKFPLFHIYYFLSAIKNECPNHEK